MFTVIMYTAAFLWLACSFFKDREKTVLALKKARKSFFSILPSVLSVLLLMGLILAVLDEGTISRLLGADSGLPGFLAAAAAGSVTLIPGFVAFPLAASLLRAGAGYPQIAVFLSSLMMVGIATFPMEKKYFGRTCALKRNLLSLASAVFTACMIGGILK